MSESLMALTKSKTQIVQKLKALMYFSQNYKVCIEIMKWNVYESSGTEYIETLKYKPGKYGWWFFFSEQTACSLY